METSGEEDRRTGSAEAVATTSDPTAGPGQKVKSRKLKLDELILVNRAVDQELASYVARESSMQNRATILIGAASLVGAVQLGSTLDWLVALNLLLTIAAAACGVVVIFPRNGEQPNPATMLSEMKRGKSAIEATEKLISVKLDVLNQDEASLSRRGRWAQRGFVLLTLGIVAGAFSGFTSAAADDAEPKPVPVASSWVLNGEE